MALDPSALSLGHLHKLEETLKLPVRSRSLCGRALDVVVRRQRRWHIAQREAATACIQKKEHRHFTNEVGLEQPAH